VDRQISASKTSLVLSNLRGFTIILVVTFHSLMAYLAYNPAPQPRYFPPPLISDAHRWIGFDLICASLYLFMMQFMFLLSGLFAWPSLVRRGPEAFVRHRLLRLGIPFVLGVYILMPPTHLPIYLLNNPNPTLSGFWAEWRDLPYWPSGPFWFLAFLLVLDLAAAAAYVLVPRSVEYAGGLSRIAKDHPLRYFWALLIASAVAYLPLAFIFLPWEWVHFGPFALQPSFALLYVVYFAAGVAMGVFGIEGSLFSAAGRLRESWMAWVAIAVLAFMLWAISMAIAGEPESSRLPGASILGALAFVIASTSACFALAATFLRQWTERSPILSALSEHAYGIYAFHATFVLWLQYLLLSLPLIAPVKAAIVIAGTLLLSWAASTLTIRLGDQLLTAKRRLNSVRLR
jgi:hypothetical protein